MPDFGATDFDALRPRLTRIAQRMLGSWAEAEDVVQDAWLRWQDSDRDAVRDPAAFLSRTVARLCLDVLKSSRVQRETYIGPWLPEPMVEDTPEETDGVTPALLLALERLSPLERAAFLLHDVFGMSFDDIAKAIGRAAPACRQLAARARDHVRAARPRFPVAPERGRDIARAFFDASRNGDVAALQGLLAEDVFLYSDGGGKVLAFRKVLTGIGRLTHLYASLARKGIKRDSALLHEGLIDGLPGFVSREKGGLLQTTALDIENERIVAIYIVRNPDKLHHLARFNRH